MLTVLRPGGQLLACGAAQRVRERELSLSEIMTILILFHQSHDRTFKAFYTVGTKFRDDVCQHLRSEFPKLVGYTRFVEFTPSTLLPILLPLCAYLKTCFGRCTGISFLDSTSLSLAVCGNPRISQHKVFQGLAARGKTSIGWFFGFNRLQAAPDLQ